MSLNLKLFPFLLTTLIPPDADVLGREPTPIELHSHTHKQQKDQQWVDECARRAYEEYTWLQESQAAAGEGSSTGSTDYSDYRTWSQAVGGMQHGRVYGLGSQAYAYEGQTSSGDNFSSSTQESSYTQQIAALTTELEQRIIRRYMCRKYDMTKFPAEYTTELSTDLSTVISDGKNRHRFLLRWNIRR
ncbi:hypothetical protein IEQ34_005150 [Dendrobium chrysotoxum]|uniref:Uncharacterized protein n=1 Tax=Dendrobium chrysotoxum TaxID=161865 RepID=A0AAV7HAZ9_DENCH|nr:hypothetical protein IEQ34_005150 [Dendrobium chrysotoxum]